MSIAMRRLWSDPTFLELLRTQHANGAVATSVNGVQPGRDEIVAVGSTQVGYPAPRPPAADTTLQVRAGNTTGAVTNHVHKNGKPAASNGAAVPSGAQQPRFVHPGDGEIVPLDQAFQELGRKSGVVIESGSRSFHKDIWQNQMGMHGDPPVAFRYAGRIRVDLERLTPEQLKNYQTLERAQAAAIAINGGDRSGHNGTANDPHGTTNPDGHSDALPNHSNGTGSDPHGTTNPDGHSDTLPNHSNGTGNGGGNGGGTGGGGAGGGRPGNTQVSHPPPPPSAPPVGHAPADPAFRYPPKAGDGEVVPIEHAFEELGRKSGKVIESGSHSWHEKLWQEQLGKTGEPPLAFTYSGRIRIDIERLTPEQLESFIKLDQAQAAAIAAGAGNKPGGGGKPGGDGGKPGGGDGGTKGGGSDAKGAGDGGAKGGAAGDASHQAMANKVNAYDGKVKKLQEKYDALQKKQGSAGPSKELAAERASLDAEQKALLQEGETLSMEMTAAAGQELKAVFNTVNPKELLNLARKGLPGRATVGAMAGIAVTLATAYFVALDIRYILDADNALEGLERAGKVGASYAAGTAEFALFKMVTGSNLLTAVLGAVAGLCGDSAGACDAQEEQKRQEEEAKQDRERGRQQRKAIGDFLAKHVPGSVMWVEDTYIILNQKVWDETVKKVDQMQRDYRANRKAGVFKRAHDLGMNDAKVMGKFVQKDEMKGWPEVKEQLTDEYELFDEYKKGFNEGNKKREAVINRATQLGYQDAKVGSKVHYDNMFKWPEVDQVIKEGAVGWIFYQELGASYNDAFDIKTGKKDPYEGLKD